MILTILYLQGWTKQINHKIKKWYTYHQQPINTLSLLHSYQNLNFYLFTKIIIDFLLAPIVNFPIPKTAKSDISETTLCMIDYTYIRQLMSQFLKQNLYQPKTLTENRVLMLTEKINSLKIGQRAEAERKLDTLDRQVTSLEEELEAVVLAFGDRHCELKHIFAKIGKELAFDFAETDRAVREETEHCEEMALKMINQHVEERRASDARLSRFVDEKCAVLRDLIEREAKERTTAIKEVEESLGRDLAEIREKLESEGRQREQRIELIHEQFLGEYERMHGEFRELTEKYAESEGEFYKMLRDVLKKVKGELAEGKREREEMEESILVLIEKICDKAMEEAGVR